MREPQMCNIVGKIKLDAKNAKEFKEKINDEYRVNMYVMPVFGILFLPVFHYHIDILNLTHVFHSFTGS
jgi:hypothetical protein